MQTKARKRYLDTLGKELASDAGHLLEIIIFLELKHRNNQV